MAFGTLPLLQASLADWVARTDLSTTTLNLFIDAAESEIMNGVYDPSGRVVIPALRCHKMEIQNTAFTLSGEYTSLPTDFLSFREVKTVANPNQILEYVTPSFFDATYLSTDTGSTAKVYTIQGQLLRVGPSAGAGDVLDIVYYQTVPNLTTVPSTTNWILQNYPLVYLYGALRHLGIYIGMDSRIPFFHGAFVSALAALHAKEKAIEFSGTSMAVQTLGVTKT
jgi:hypothetical protein